MIIETDSDLYYTILSNWRKQAVHFGLREFSDWIEKHHGMVHVNRNFQHRDLRCDGAGIVSGVDCIFFDREQDYLMFILKNT